MIPNAKKVMFLALVPALQWNSHPHFLVYICSKWSSRMALKRAITNPYSSKYYHGKKTKNLPRTNKFD